MKRKVQPNAYYCTLHCNMHQEFWSNQCKESMTCNNCSAATMFNSDNISVNCCRGHRGQSYHYVQSPSKAVWILCTSILPFMVLG